MPNAQSLAEERIVVIHGSSSELLEGDADRERLKERALPLLLHQGWKIKGAHAAGERLYVVLDGSSVPPPVTTEEERAVEYEENLRRVKANLTPEQAATWVEEEREHARNTPK